MHTILKKCYTFELCINKIEHKNKNETKIITFEHYSCEIIYNPHNNVYYIMKKYSKTLQKTLAICATNNVTPANMKSISVTLTSN